MSRASDVSSFFLSFGPFCLCFICFVFDGRSYVIHLSLGGRSVVVHTFICHSVVVLWSFVRHSVVILASFGSLSFLGLYGRDFLTNYFSFSCISYSVT